MAKAGRGADQYMLRFPPGLRDRIKAYAERMGTSINSEIIRILELEFPEQWPAEDRLAELGEMLSVLKAGSSDPHFAEFSAKLEETIDGIVSGRVKDVSPEAREAVSSMWHDIKLRESENALDAAEDHYWGRTDEEIENHRLTGNFEKYEKPLPRPIDPFKDNRMLMDVLPPSTLAELTERLSKTDIDGAIEVLRAAPIDEIRRRAEFQKLPVSEQYRILGQVPPDDSDDPFSFTEDK